jgi:hypothetical protein
VEAIPLPSALTKRKHSDPAKAASSEMTLQTHREGSFSNIANQDEAT